MQVKGDEFQSITPFSATAYALNVADSAITTPKIADNAVTNSKLVDHSVTWNKMGTEYIPYLRVNGTKINTGQNSINFMGSDGLKVDYDSTTLSLIIHTDSGLTNLVVSKGAHPLSITAWVDGGTGEANTAGSGNFSIGDNTSQASNVYLGAGKTAPSGDVGYDWTLHGEDGNGTDEAGGSIGFYAGKPTGAGAGGSIKFSVGIPSGTGTGLDAGFAPMAFIPSGNSLATATGTLQIGANGQATGKISLANETDSHTGTLEAESLSDNQTWTLPNGSGSIAVVGLPWADGFFEADAIGHSIISILGAQDQTPSTSGSPTQFSPAIYLVGSAWNTSTLSSNYLYCNEYLVPSSGASPSAALTWQIGPPLSAIDATLNSAGVFSPSTGFQIAQAPAALGHFLRGNGSDYVDGAIELGDLPLTGASTGSAIMDIGGSVAYQQSLIVIHGSSYVMGGSFGPGTQLAILTIPASTSNHFVPLSVHVVTTGISGTPTAGGLEIGDAITPNSICTAQTPTTIANTRQIFTINNPGDVFGTGGAVSIYAEATSATAGGTITVEVDLIGFYDPF